MARPLRPLLLFALSVALLPLLGLVDLALQRRQLAGRSEPGEEYRLPQPALLRALCFGYNELAADLAWIRTIVYFTDHLAGDRQFPHLERYVQTILALDDHFEEVYRFAPSMFINRQDQKNDDVQAAIRILEKGHQHYPKRYEFPFSLGAYYMSELRTDDPKQRARWRRKAADWIRRAALIGSGMPWLPSLAAKLYTEQGQRELALKHLQELFLTTQDPETKRQIAAKLRDLQAEHLAKSIRERAAAFARRHQRSAVPYIPPDLYVLLELPTDTPWRLEDYTRSETFAATNASDND